MRKIKVSIQNAIRESACVLFLLSSNSAPKRGFIQKELREVIDALDEIPESEIFLIPARLDECNSPHHRLTEIHWVDLFPSYDEGFCKIVQALSQRIDFPITIELIYQNPNALEVFEMVDEISKTLNSKGMRVIRNNNGPFNSSVVPSIEYTEAATDIAPEVKSILAEYLRSVARSHHASQLKVYLKETTIPWQPKVWVYI